VGRVKDRGDLKQGRGVCLLGKLPLSQGQRGREEGHRGEYSALRHTTWPISFGGKKFGQLLLSGS